MIRYIATFVGILLFGAACIGVANAQITTPRTSTPDISVTSTATVDVVLSGRSEWIYLKNDCSEDLYFDLAGNADPNGSHFPLRLKQNQSFSGWLRTQTIGVSPASGNTGACTFTLQHAR